MTGTVRKVRATAADGDAAATAFAIADFLVRTEVERERLFHRHLRATVLRVSPLLVDLALLEGLALGEAVRLVRPPQDWPWRPLADHEPSILRRSLQRRPHVGIGDRNEVARFRRAFADPGLVVRDADHPRGRLAIRPCDGALGFTAGLGACVLSAFGATAMLRLPEPLPETLTMSLPGRRLGGVVDHPLFRDAAYRIIRVVPDLLDGAPVLVFRAALVSFAIPKAGPAAMER